MIKYLIVGIVVLLTCIFFLFKSLNSTKEELGRYKAKVDYLELEITTFNINMQKANDNAKKAEKIIQQLREKMRPTNEKDCYNNSVPDDIKQLLHNL